MTACHPKNSQKYVLYMKEIEVRRYDFSNAGVRLVGSVNGRYTGQDMYKYGQKRIKEIMNGK